MAYVTNVTTNADTNAPIGSSLSGTCDTAADVAAKVATVQGFDELTSGVTIHVKFAYGNTASAPTLNVSGTGARYIYAHGTTSPEVSWTAGTVLSLTYIGDAWMLNDAMTEQIRSLQDVISNAKSLLGNLGLDANGNPLVSASAARATLDAAQSESASGSLYDAEQAISDNTAAISTLRDSLSGLVTIANREIEWTTTTTMNNTGVSVTVPAGKPFMLFAIQNWKDAKPQGICISTLSNAWDGASTPISDNACMASISGYRSYAQTYYIWAKAANANQTNFIRVGLVYLNV